MSNMLETKSDVKETKLSSQPFPLSGELQHAKDRKKNYEDTMKQLESEKAQRDLANKINNTDMAKKRLESWINAKNSNDPYFNMKELCIIKDDLIPEEVEKMKKLAEEKGYKHEPVGCRIKFTFH
jgi:hypothetical protein